MENDSKQRDEVHPGYSFHRDGSFFNPKFIENKSFSDAQFCGYAVMAELISKLPADGAPNDTIDGLLQETLQDYQSKAPTHDGRRGAAASVVFLLTEILVDAIVSGRAEAVFLREVEFFFHYEEDEIKKGRAEINALLPQRKEEPEVRLAKRRVARVKEVAA